jgi:FkbM family methyltransferase
MADEVVTIKNADAAFAAGDMQKTLAICERILTVQPEHYWATFIAGNAHERLGNRPEAARAWRRAIDLPDDARIDAYHYLLRQEFQDQDFSNFDLLNEALALSLHSTQKRWHHAPLLFLSGVRYLVLGNLSAAERSISAAYNFYPDVDETGLAFHWLSGSLSAISDISKYPSLRYLLRSSVARATPISYQRELAALQSDTVVLEIGAMDGVEFDSLRRFITDRGWIAVLVEPTLEMFSELQANYTEYDNVRCVRAAITDRSGELIMHRMRPDAIGTSGVGDWAPGVSSASTHLLKFYDGLTVQEAVPAMTFDQVTHQTHLSHIDVLQIDTEGHDWTIFKQMNLEQWKIKLIHMEIRWLEPVERLCVFDSLDAAEYTVGFDGHNVTAKIR